MRLVENASPPREGLSIGTTNTAPANIAVAVSSDQTSARLEENRASPAKARRSRTININERKPTNWSRLRHRLYSSRHDSFS